MRSCASHDQITVSETLNTVLPLAGDSCWTDLRREQDEKSFSRNYQRNGRVRPSNILGFYYSIDQDTIELSVSPSPRTQTSQWQWSIRSTGADIFRFQLHRETLMLSCALARYLWLKLANVNVSESMLTYKPNVLASCTV